MMKKTYWLITLSIMLLMSSLTPAAAEESKKVVKIGITGDESTLNPYTYITGYPGLDLVNLLYDNLFQLDEENTPQPWLVDEYKVSQDGLNYEMKLHDDVLWQDGKKLTTDDVAFTIQYFLDHPKSRFTSPLEEIKKVEIKDDKTIILRLSKANPNFLIQPLADLPILPKHIWKDIKNPDESSNSLGSGPYQLKEYKSGQYYKMVAHQKYFKGKPQIDELIFPIIEDTTALYTALQAGEIDAASSSVSPELVKQFEGASNLKIMKGAGYNTSLFQMNAEKYPMTEKEFRQAIAYAIDTQYLVDHVLLGYAEKGSPGFIHPSSPAYNSSLTFKPSKEKANQILDDAGFIDKDKDGYREDPNGKKLQLTSLVYADNPIRIRTAEIIADWLKEVGIRVSVKAMDATTVDSLMWPEFDVSKGRDYDLGLWSWSSTMQLFPDRLVDLFHSDPAIGTVNIGGYKNNKFDSMVSALKDAKTEEDRLAKIKEMQAFVSDEMPIVPLYYQEIVNAYNPKAYDGYTFQLGKGIIHKGSFIPFENGEKSAQTQDADSGDVKNSETNTNSNKSLIILGLLVIVVIIGVFFIKKKVNGKKG
ncbi:MULTISPECIES: ABC transporter substrate-binding protein [unclassified Fictibacillus]|uniref:ABC transporter substrate-binding protein n=1 Tax=unclassified Fictibacillus TaxID=2644029 RepID=UPI001E43B4FE|nr:MULTISPECIES: ABC transporter substrate-binding protein [unclassified Fictibacillus]